MKLFVRYKIKFDIWGLILFLVIMIPNFIWFAVPAPNDVLRTESITQTIDTIASVFQVIMVALLCVVVNVANERPMNKKIVTFIVVMIIIYFIGWIAYYLGVINPLIIMDLCIAPCMAFIGFSIGRTNIIALLSAIIFAICHVLYGIINFIV